MDPAELRQLVELARERKRATETRIGKWSYLRFVDKFRSLPEGTVVVDDAVIWGYPKIGRILWLDTGIAEYFEHAFWIEEKIDGYNVRVCRFGDDIVALTRRGYVCPFTTDRLPDLLDLRVFARRPELVLCAEVAGPENPYNEGSPAFIGEDVRLFVFDVMRRGQPGFVSHRDKTRLLERYDLPGVPQYGHFSAEHRERIRALVLKLDREGGEGIVMKEDSRRDRRVKYVTGSINVHDIRVSEGSIRQLPAEYFMHRILRLVLFLEEHGIEPTSKTYRELGASLIDGTIHAIEQYRTQRKVYHSYRCRFRRRGNAELLMSSLSRLLGEGQVRQRRLQREGEFFVLEFDKILPRTTGLLQYVFKGGVLFD